MDARPEQLTSGSQAPKRGRLMLLVLFWILAVLICLNAEMFLGRLNLHAMWTLLEFLGCLLVVYILLWKGKPWARRCGVAVFLVWAAVFLWPALVSGPYLAPAVHFALAGLLLFLALALVFSEDVVQFLDSRRRPESRAFDVSHIAPVIHQLRQGDIVGPRVGSKGARFRRVLLAAARRTVSSFEFFRRDAPLGAGTHERESDEG